MIEDEEISDQYDLLRQQLTTANASVQVAEAHGFICGVIATDQPIPADWFEEVFDQSEEGDLLVKDCQGSLKQLYKETLDEIEGAGIGMQLLLPSDSKPLPERARAVSQWCQGFLYAIGLTGNNNQSLSEEAREALEDMSAFTRIDIEELEDDADDIGENNSGDDEDALVEITEFLWVAAMLIRESYLNHQQADLVENQHEYH
jgi:yecA family protein